MEKYASDQRSLRIIQETTELFVNWKELWYDKLVEADELRKFVLDANEQWTTDEKKKFREKGKAFIAINICLRLLMNLMGMYSSNKREVRAVSETSNTAMSDLHTKMLKYVSEQLNDYDSVFERQFSDGNMMRCGGWARLYYGVKDGEKQIIYENKEATSIVNDPMATQYDNSDSRGIFESEFYSIDKITELFPDHAEEIMDRHKHNTRDESWFEEIVNGSLDTVRSLRSEGFDKEFQNKKAGMYRLLIYNYPRSVINKYVYDATEGKAFRLGEEKENKESVKDKALMALVKKDPNRYEFIQKREKVYYLRAIIPALLYVIQDKRIPCKTNNFQYFRYAPYNMARSLIDEVSVFTNLKPIQREKNKHRSLIADYMDKYIHPRTWIKKGSLSPDQMQKFRNGDDNIEYTGEQIPRTDQIHGITNELLVHDQVNTQDFEDLSGVTKSVQGVTKSEDNTSLYKAKLAQSSLGLQPLLKNLGKTRLAVASATHEMIKYYMTEPMQVNISAEDAIEGETLMLNLPVNGKIHNDMSSGFYKIKLVDGPYSETAKERYLGQVMMLIERMPPELIPWPFIFDLMDLGSNTEKWKEYVINTITQNQEGQANALAKEQIREQMEATLQAKEMDLNAVNKKRDFNLKVAELIQANKRDREKKSA